MNPALFHFKYTNTPKIAARTALTGERPLHRLFARSQAKTWTERNAQKINSLE